MTGQTCATPIVVKVATGPRPYRIVMRRCGAPAETPAQRGMDEHGPILLPAACAEHGGRQAVAS